MSTTRKPGLWAGLMLASFGVIAALRMTGAINASTAYVLLIVAALPAIPLIRSGMARKRSQGRLSPATASYTRRFLLASFGYMLGLGLAVTIATRADLGRDGSFFIALLPVLPVLGMIWAMGRYLVEEEDEFLRHRAIMASLLGLGAVLVLGTFWGFLETFGVVPHVDAWWVFPVWAAGMGLGQCWMALGDRTGDRS